MNTRHFLIGSIVIICFFAACKKKEHISVTPKTPVTDPTKQDPIVIVSYPYTDTFSGSLRMFFDDGGYDSVYNPYLFYVRYINSDSLVFISSDTIFFGSSSEFRDRYFNNGYKVSASNTYLFDPYFATNGSSTSPPGNKGTFYLIHNNLQIEWYDTYADELRLSNPTGGVHFHTRNGTYYGTLIRH